MLPIPDPYIAPTISTEDSLASSRAYPAEAARGHHTRYAPRYSPAFPPHPSHPEQPATSPIYGRLTIDGLIRSGEFQAPDGDPALAILNDKHALGWAGVEDVIAQIRARYEIYDRNLRDLLYASCAATNALHTWRAERGEPSDRQLDNLHKTLQGIYEEERAERQSLWRDISRLRLALPELAGSYLSAARKLQILNQPRGDRW